MAHFSFDAPDGTAVAGWRNDGDGIPVVISNGLGTSPMTWPTIAAPDSGFRVATWYYRGTGGGTRPADESRVAIEDHVEDLLALMDHEGMEQAVLACWSLGVNVGFELHPGEDLFDGATFEMFLGRLDGHPRCGINYDPSHFVLQCLDYLEFIDLYHERIFAFHVKDAEFNPTGRQGVYGGFQSWVNRAGRFRSLGDGHVDFRGIFSRLTQYGYAGWAVLEWECCLKHPEDGAREGSAFIRDHIIRVTERAFDDFAGSGVDQAANRRVLGLDGKAP